MESTRHFKPSEKMYISKNANSKTLEEMAQVLKCKESEVKRCFEQMKRSGEYDKYRVASYDLLIQEERKQEPGSSNKQEEENSLLDLNNYLFSQLKALNEDLSCDEFKREVEKSKVTVSLAQTIINNEKLLLEASKHFKGESKQVRQVLGAGEE